MSVGARSGCESRRGVRLSPLEALASGEESLEKSGRQLGGVYSVGWVEKKVWASIGWRYSIGLVSKLSCAD
jgi:hypothetical protein